VKPKPTIAICLALACAAALASSALAAETSHTSPRLERHALHHVNVGVAPRRADQAPNDAAAPPPFSWLTRLFPNVKPYPPGEGDADGLSRNIEDCNKGCIGINPIR
jgi:hypothetical protein